MPTLSAYANVENTAVVILRKKGYQVWYSKDVDLFYAEKDGWDFGANGAVELLGIIAIFEHHKPDHFREYWWKIDDPDIIRNLPSTPNAYDPVWKRK